MTTRRTFKVDPAGFLRGRLTSYEPSTMLREQVQNADDACHRQGRCGALQVEFHQDRLVFINPSLMEPPDWEYLLNAAASEKYEDDTQTGEFGVGFWSVMHLTDAPVITSGNTRMVVDPLADYVDQTPLEEPRQETRIELPYRRSTTETARRVDVGPVDGDTIAELERQFAERLDELLLFTRTITEIVLHRSNATTLRAHRDIQPVTDRIDKLRVMVQPARSEGPSEFLRVRTTLADPPKRRHGEIDIALPIPPAADEPGRIFCTFPTEADAGLSVSINAAFQPTEDRRTIKHDREGGQWNTHIFTAAGDALGEVLPALLDATDHEGLTEAEALRWFVPIRTHRSEVHERAQAALTSLDRHAQTRPVLRDRHGTRRVGDDLKLLDPSVDAILGAHIDGALTAPTEPAITEVMRRWGVVHWGAAEVAGWLQNHTGDEPIEQAHAPPFLQHTEDLLALLGYCDRHPDQLTGALMALGTDGRLYPVGDRRLPRPTPSMRRLIAGLSQPVLDGRLDATAAGRAAPETTAQWLRAALLVDAQRLAGTKVGTGKVGCLATLAQTKEAIRLLVDADYSPKGTPLAVRPDRTAAVFDEQVVHGLPRGKEREAATALAAHLGLTPLHADLDDPSLLARVSQPWTVELLLAHLPEASDGWDSQQAQRLLTVLWQLHDERPLSGDAVAQLRRLPLWPTGEGTMRPLDELYLPPPDRHPRGSTPRLLDEAVLGEAGSADLNRTFLHRVLQLEMLDTTEESVQACEAAGDQPLDTDELQGTIEALATASPSAAQQHRLRAARFVPCQDGKLRVPEEALLTPAALPPPLSERRATKPITDDRRLRQFLTTLGARELPTGAELAEAAKVVAATPAREDHTDPGRQLWDFLNGHADRYDPSALSPLAAIPWVAAAPGPKRLPPRELVDPALQYAGMLFCYPAGVGSPGTRLREALGIRNSLSVDELVQLGRAAARAQEALPAQYFQTLEKWVAQDEGAAGKINRRLCEEPLIPVDGGFARPCDLVARARAELWRHLKSPLSEDFRLQYPHLLDIWGVDRGEADIRWQDHADVLEALADRDVLDERDRHLACERSDSLAHALHSEPGRAPYMARRRCLLTSQGIVRPAVAFRRDLPAALTDRLTGHLPVADRCVPEHLPRHLDARSLRDEITFEPLASTPVPDAGWQQRLGTHATGVLRFLWHFAEDVPDFLTDSWPPTVMRTPELHIRASHDSQTLEQRAAQAFLGPSNDGLVLYVTGDLSTESIVDAIRTSFGLRSGTGSLLCRVLDAASPDDAARTLDWEDVQPWPPPERPDWSVPEVSVALPESPGAPLGDQQQPPAEDSPTPAEAAADRDPSPSPASASATTTDPSPQPGGQPAPSEGSADDQSLPQRPTPPRGHTDFDRLRAQGIDVDTRQQPTAPEQLESEDDDPAVDHVRVRLSWYDVHYGLLPLDRSRARKLAGNDDVQQAILFDAQHPAQQHDDTTIRIDDAAAVFADRQIVAGTVVHLHPGPPGTIECEFVPDEHVVTDVWWLEVDENGRLVRHRDEAVTVYWETDGPFYRCERRWEDLEAWYREAQLSGKSAQELLIDVFRTEGEQGLTTDEAWQAVAMYRLFARSTIASTLSDQSDLFERRDGRWYLCDDPTVWRRRTGPQQPSTPASPPPPTSDPTHEEVRDLANRLASLLAQADAALRDEIISILGLAATKDSEETNG